MPLSSSIKVVFQATESSAIDLATRESATNIARALVYTSGTGLGQVDLLFSDQRTLTASATENLDFNGALTGAFAAVNFIRLKAILVVASAANINNVNVIRPAANGVPLFLAASDGLAVRPGGFFLLACNDAVGIVVAGGTADLLTFTNDAGSTSVVYEVVLLGTSA